MEQIEMVYVPVPDLPQALAHYRDALGWTELWREGETTAAIGPRGGQVTLMLDLDTDGSSAAGPMLSVDDVRSWIDDRRDRLTVVMDPSEIPGGWLAGVEDPFGNLMYVIDQSTANES